MLQLSLSPRIIWSANARDSIIARNSFTWATEQVEIKSSRTKLTTGRRRQFLSSRNVNCEKNLGIRGGEIRNLWFSSRGRTINHPKKTKCYESKNSMNQQPSRHVKPNSIVHGFGAWINQTVRTGDRGRWPRTSGITFFVYGWLWNSRMITNSIRRKGVNTQNSGICSTTKLTKIVTLPFTMDNSSWSN
jgi:hypothetical protein